MEREEEPQAKEGGHVLKPERLSRGPWRSRPADPWISGALASRLWDHTCVALSLWVCSDGLQQLQEAGATEGAGGAGTRWARLLVPGGWGCLSLKCLSQGSPYVSPPYQKIHRSTNQLSVWEGHRAASQPETLRVPGSCPEGEAVGAGVGPTWDLAQAGACGQSGQPGVSTREGLGSNSKQVIRPLLQSTPDVAASPRTSKRHSERNSKRLGRSHVVHLRVLPLPPAPRDHPCGATSFWKRSPCGLH